MKKLDFKITNVSDEKLDVSLIDMPIGMFKVSLPKSIKPGKTETGTIEITDEYVPEEFEKSITLEFAGKEATRFTIPVKRVIRIPGEKAKSPKSESNVSGG